MQVQARAPEHTLEVLRVVCIKRQLLIDARRVDVIELEAGAHAVEDVGILFRSQSGDGVCAGDGQGLGSQRGSLDGRDFGARQRVDGVQRGGIGNGRSGRRSGGTLASGGGGRGSLGRRGVRLRARRDSGGGLNRRLRFWSRGLAIRWGGGAPRHAKRKHYQWREGAPSREFDSQFTPPEG